MLIRLTALAIILLMAHPMAHALPPASGGSSCVANHDVADSVAMSRFSIHKWEEMAQRENRLRQNSNFSFLSLTTGMALPLGQLQVVPGTTILRMPALLAGLRGGWALSDHWSLESELGLLSTPLIIEVGYEQTNLKSQTGLHFIESASYNYVINSRVRFIADVGIGYRKIFQMTLEDDAVRFGGGTPVGRVNAGFVFRFSSRFTARVALGYELSRYRVRLRPSNAYLITRPAERRGSSSLLLISVASRYEF